MLWDALENEHVSLDMRKYTTWELSKNQEPSSLYVYIQVYTVCRE